MIATCAICGDPMQRTIARPQYGLAVLAQQRPWVHTNYRKPYDHDALRQVKSAS